MSGGTVVMDVRELSPRTSVVDIRGDVTAASEGPLMDAYSKASGPATRVLVLNFSGLEYMNSGGIGMLVTLLVRANRQRQQLLAFGLNDHYRQIFELTRLDEAIGIHANEADALAAAGERRAGRDTP
jgi:anti-sigma B factor antagonist